MKSSNTVKNSLLKVIECHRLLKESINELNISITSVDKKDAFTEEYLTKEEFKVLLKISESTYSRWKKKKRFKDKVLGRGKVFIHKSEVDKLINDSS